MYNFFPRFFLVNFHDDVMVVFYLKSEFHSDCCMWVFVLKNQFSGSFELYFLKLIIKIYVQQVSEHKINHFINLQILKIVILFAVQAMKYVN